MPFFTFFDDSLPICAIQGSGKVGRCDPEKADLQIVPVGSLRQALKHERAQ